MTRLMELLLLLSSVVFLCDAQSLRTVNNSIVLQIGDGEHSSFFFWWTHMC